MRTLVDYQGLAKRIHISTEECISQMGEDGKFFDKQRKSNPDYFIDIDDKLIEFFENWHSDSAQNFLVEQQGLATLKTLIFNIGDKLDGIESVLQALLPVITPLTSKLNTLMATTQQINDAIDKVFGDMQTKLNAARAEVKSLRDVAAGNNGKLDPASFDATLAHLNDIDGIITNFDIDSSAPATTGPDTPTSPATGGDAPATSDTGTMPPVTPQG